MRRVAPSFVASDRHDSGREGVAFITRPLPYGDNLCRVDIVSFPAKIVTGRADPNASRFEDNLTLRRGYGVWTTSAKSGDTRDVACSRYRDFQHLVFGDGLAIDRTVAVLAKAIAAVRAGDASFHVGCATGDGGKVISCSVSRATILALVAAEFGNVEAQSHKMGKDSATYVDVLTTRGRPAPHGCMDFSVVRIESRQSYGTESMTNPDPVDFEFLPGGPVC
jgi:hypothetical protein